MIIKATENEEEGKLSEIGNNIILDINNNKIIIISIYQKIKRVIDLNYVKNFKLIFHVLNKW